MSQMNILLNVIFLLNISFIFCSPFLGNFPMPSNVKVINPIEKHERNVDKQPEIKPENPIEKKPILKDVIQDTKNENKEKLPNESDKKNSNQQVNIPVTQTPKEINIPQNPNDTNNVNPYKTPEPEESRVLTRGMMVLLTVSLLFISFVGYKTYRRSSRKARIRKYGVRLTRGNIEMTPLPLDNDDDDETVFDLKNVPI